jgi:hypothetical protein
MSNTINRVEAASQYVCGSTEMTWNLRLQYSNTGRRAEGGMTKETRQKMRNKMNRHTSYGIPEFALEMKAWNGGRYRRRGGRGHRDRCADTW